MSEAAEFRIEHDTMGEVRVPKSALYRAQTQRAVENFPISGTGLESAQIVALARIKRAAAIVNGELGIVEPAVAEDEDALGLHLSDHAVPRDALGQQLLVGVRGHPLVVERDQV